VTAILEVRDLHTQFNTLDGVEQLDRALTRRPPARDAVDGERFFDLAADREHWIQCRAGLLKHEPDAAAADAVQVVFAQREEVAFVEHDASSGDPARRPHQAQDGERRHRLSTAGFAHEAQRFTGADPEAHPVDRHHGSACSVEHGRQPLD